MYTQIHRYINSLRTSATDWKPSLGKTQIIRTCSTQQPDFPVSINPRCKSKCLWKKGNPGPSSPWGGWSSATSCTRGKGMPWAVNSHTQGQVLHAAVHMNISVKPQPQPSSLCEVGTWSKWSSTEIIKCCWHTQVLQDNSLTFWRDPSPLSWFSENKLDKLTHF